MSSQLIQCVPAHQDQMKDLKDDRMVADTTNGATVVVVVVDMKAPPGRDRHHHEEDSEDAEVDGVAEDIIEAERIILPNIKKNNKYCIHNNNQLGIPILILKRTNLVAPCYTVMRNKCRS